MHTVQNNNVTRVCQEQVRGRGTISTFRNAAGGTDLRLVNHEQSLYRHSALNFMCVVFLKHCRQTG